MRKIFIFFLAVALSLCCFIPSFATESSDQASRASSSPPSDLTGYTITVPSGWTASAGYCNYDIQGTFTDSVYGENPFTALYVGYALNFDTFITEPSNNAVVYLGYASTFPNGCSLSFTVSSGTDSSNSSLIQWLVDNNATFSGGSEPEPVTYSIPSGYYKLAELPSSGVPSVGGFVVNIEHLFEVPVEVYYSSGVVKQYNYFGFMLTNFTDSNNFSVDFTVQLLDIGTSIRIANLTAVDGVCSSQFYGGISNIYFGEDIVTDEDSYQLISFMFDVDSSFVPDIPDVPDITINPWGYILEMIIEALKVPLFGYFSVWDIFVTICGIFILTWLLKLLAGG